MTIVKTNHNTIIGVYCPNKIEDTTEMINQDDDDNGKSTVGLKPFFFYFQDNKQLEILKFREDIDYIPTILSNINFMIRIEAFGLCLASGMDSFAAVDEDFIWP